MKTNLVSAVCAALALSAFGGLQGAVVNFRADRATCVYETGETAKLSVTVAETNGVALTSGRVRLVVDNFGNVRSEEREIDLAKDNPFEVRVSRTEPGFARLTVTPADPAQKLDGGVFGVGFSPEKIVSGTPEPADFDAFWSEAIAKLDRTVPVDAQMELVPEKSKGERNYYRVSFATCQGRRVYGWLSEPKDLSGGPFPVRVSVPGAGIGALGVEGDGKTVALLMNVHTYPQPEDDGPYDGGERRRLYDAQDARYAKPNGVARYCQAGIHRSREDYFYYASILGINRAVNWLAARPECDRGDFTYAGTSQGGGFGLMLTALNSHITKSCIFVPAITDLLGFRVGDRQSGWPRIIEAQRPENRAAAERWAPYFCGVNFARRIRVPIRFVAGFADNTCSPNAVYSAYNACPSADKGIFDGIGMGHRVFSDFYTRLDAWQRARTDAKGAYHGVPAVRGMAAKVFHVSPQGDDAAAGSADRPFRSLARARDAARAAGRPARIVLADGLYTSDAPLAFTSDDRHLEIVAAKGASPVVSAGRRITDWTVDAKGRWHAAVPKGVRFSQFYVNGQRRQRPFLPRSGYYFVKSGVEKELRTEREAACLFPQDWPKGENPEMEFCMFTNWKMLRAKVLSYDAAASRVTLDVPPMKNDFDEPSDKRWYRLDNVRSALGEPGDWYLDAARPESSRTCRTPTRSPPRARRSPPAGLMR